MLLYRTGHQGYKLERFNFYLKKKHVSTIVLLYVLSVGCTYQKIIYPVVPHVSFIDIIKIESNQRWVTIMNC